MEAVTGVPVSVYLATAYRPDREYVEGEVIERNVGERLHSRLQVLLVRFFAAVEIELGLEVLSEQRLQVKPDRPDVCVARSSEPWEDIITHPPLICIEILSSEDRMAEMQDRIADYLAFGVPHVWIVNPYSRKAYVCERGEMKEAADGVLRIGKPRIELPLADLFARLRG